MHSGKDEKMFCNCGSNRIFCDKNDNGGCKAKVCIQCMRPYTSCICSKTSASLDIPVNSEDKPKPIKSDGGSSSYYTFEVITDVSNVKHIDNSEKVAVTLVTGDIIKHLVGNDFSLGNIIKACRRIYMGMKGAGKEGIDIKYDATKIKYFADDVIKICENRL